MKRPDPCVLELNPNDASDYYDFKRVFIKVLELRESYFDERARLKDSYNDLIALLKEMNDDGLFSKLISRRHRLFREKVCATYFSCNLFLKEMSFNEELYDTVVAKLNVGMPLPAEDLPTAIHVLSNSRKFYYGIWLEGDLYDFANEMVSSYEKLEVGESA